MTKPEVETPAPDAFTASAEKKQRNLKPFKPGTSGNPAGREKGSRSKMGEAFLEDVRDLWARRGKDILDKCADTEPMQTAKMVASLLPREFLVKATMVNVDITAGHEDLEAYMRDWRLARQRIGVKEEPPMLLEADDDGDTSDNE
jgi:hypothetical protein